MPTPGISEEEFAFLIKRAGLSFGAAQLAEMYAAYAQVERMAENVRGVSGVRGERNVDAEPAHIFAVPGKGG